MLGLLRLGLWWFATGKYWGGGVSSVVASKNPVAHAEVNAIVSACRSIGSHLVDGATLYCSCFPCPLCLMAAYWARIGRIVAAAPLTDSAKAGFEDEEFYRQLSMPNEVRSLRVEVPASPLRTKVADLLAQWKTLHHYYAMMPIIVTVILVGRTAT